MTCGVTSGINQQMMSSPIFVKMKNSYIGESFGLPRNFWPPFLAGSPFPILTVPFSPEKGRAG